MNTRRAGLAYCGCGVSARFPPIEDQFNIPHLPLPSRYVGCVNNSLLCSETFFSGCSTFPFPPNQT